MPSIFSKGFLKKSFGLLGGNIIVILLGASYQFLLPKLISVNDYGIFKAFTLYLSYLGLTHFGLKDGIYFKLCEKKDINQGEKNSFFTLIIVQQLIVSLLFYLFYLLFLSDDFGEVKFIGLLLTLVAFTQIISTFSESYYFSKKHFLPSVFSKVIKEGSFITIILVLWHFNYLSLQSILFGFAISVVLQFLYYQNLNKDELVFSIKSLKRSKRWFKRLYILGIKLQSGNLSHQISINLDRLLISFFYSKELFAKYAFAGTFVVLINLGVNSFSQVLLPYLFEEGKKDLQSNYNRLSIVSFGLSQIAFPVVWGSILVIRYFYPAYLESLQILFGLSFGIPALTIVGFLHNNHLKALNLLKMYNFINWTILLIFGATLFYLLNSNFSLYKISLLFSVAFLLKVVVFEIGIRVKLSLPQAKIIWPFIILILGSVINYFIGTLLIV